MKRALVTGAAKGGIGAAIATRLKDDGMEVVTLDLNPGCDLQLDIYSSPLDPEVFGTFDVIVANAAVVDTIAPSHEMTEEQWNRDVNVNLTGTWRTVRACLGGMRDRRYGRIVVVSSGAAEGGLPGQVAYSASKAGLLGMVRTLASEQAAMNITANAILPGPIASEHIRSLPEAAQDLIVSGTPAGRMGTPEEVAHLASFLSSELSGFVTGEAIGIDGGVGLIQVHQ